MVLALRTVIYGRCNTRLHSFYEYFKNLSIDYEYSQFLLCYVFFTLYIYKFLCLMYIYIQDYMYIYIQDYYKIPQL